MEYTEAKCVDAHSQQMGKAAGTALPAIHQNNMREE
jgi:hypothetical protein